MGAPRTKVSFKHFGWLFVSCVVFICRKAQQAIVFHSHRKCRYEQVECGYAATEPSQQTKHIYIETIYWKSILLLWCSFFPSSPHVPWIFDCMVIVCCFTFGESVVLPLLLFFWFLKTPAPFDAFLTTSSWMHHNDRLAFAKIYRRFVVLFAGTW